VAWLRARLRERLEKHSFLHTFALYLLHSDAHCVMTLHTICVSHCCTEYFQRLCSMFARVFAMSSLFLSRISRVKPFVQSATARLMTRELCQVLAVSEPMQLAWLVDVKSGDDG
jgi:hypothetical protein